MTDFEKQRASRDDFYSAQSRFQLICCSPRSRLGSFCEAALRSASLLRNQQSGIWQSRPASAGCENSDSGLPTAADVSAAANVIQESQGKPLRQSSLTDWCRIVFAKWFHDRSFRSTFHKDAKSPCLRTCLLYTSDAADE